MLIKGRQFIAGDDWRHVEDDETLPDEAPVIVSLARWQRDRASLSGRNAPLGIRLPNDVPASVLEGDLDRFAIVVLNFPRFNDGRAYSQARLLRSRLGYKGELRAGGNVLRDQLLFMQRCGFDSFEVGERAIAEDWLKAFGEFDVFYQPAEDARPWVMRQRARSA